MPTPTGLQWQWIVMMATLPTLAGLLVAYPLWRARQTLLGNLAGTGVIFAAALGFIAREYLELDRVTQACIDAGTTCWPVPSAFTRFAVYAGLGLLQVCALFVVSVRTEERLRDERYAPEWRARR
jgi:hypothetical protein